VTDTTGNPGRIPASRRGADYLEARPRHPESRYPWRTWVPVALWPMAPIHPDAPEIGVITDCPTAALAVEWIRGLYDPANQDRLEGRRPAELPVSPGLTRDDLAAFAETSDEFGQRGWGVGETPTQLILSRLL
jgi:hypothetical protein